jgi:hypothetical protein
VNDHRHINLPINKLGLVEIVVSTRRWAAELNWLHCTSYVVGVENRRESISQDGKDT